MGAGCSASPPPSREVEAKPSPSSSVRSIDAPRTEVALDAGAEEDAGAEPARDDTPSVAFPPPNVAPPFDKTKKPGDGAWSVIEPGLATTVIHPHATKWDVVVHLVAIDRRKFDVDFVAGTEEPKSANVPKEHRPGLVPKEKQGDLAIVFNGGFMARHGQWGMKIGDDVFLPLKDDACSIAKDASSIRIATWSSMSKDEKSFAWVRQTPPCLVEGGAVNADTEGEYSQKKWGAAEGGQKDIRRSALGLDASGTILFYGSGEFTFAKTLAAAMLDVGCVSAAELDINYSYTKLLFYDHDASGPKVRGALVKDTKFGAKTYFDKASERDFFFVTRRR